MGVAPSPRTLHIVTQTPGSRFADPGSARATGEQHGWSQLAPGVMSGYSERYLHAPQKPVLSTATGTRSRGMVSLCCINNVTYELTSKTWEQFHRSEDEIPHNERASERLRWERARSSVASPATARPASSGTSRS